MTNCRPQCPTCYAATDIVRPGSALAAFGVTQLKALDPRVHAGRGATLLSARSVSIFADQECMSCEQERKLRASSQRAILLKISRTRIETSRRTVPRELPPPAVRMTAPFAFLLPPA